MINQKLIDTVLSVSKEVVNEQTLAELNELGQRLGRIYDEATLAAEIAVKMMLRIAHISIETRSISPVDDLTAQALLIHAERYGSGDGI